MYKNLLYILSIVVILSSCSTIHKPAKIIEGVNIGLTGTAIFGGQADVYNKSILDTSYRGGIGPDGQLEFGYGFKEAKSYIAIKIPMVFYLANLDLYYQWLEQDKWNCGTGIEIGILMSIYGILGYEITPDTEIGIGNKFAISMYADTQSSNYDRPMAYDVWLQYWWTINTWFKTGIDSGISFHRTAQAYPYSYDILGFHQIMFHTSLSARFNF